jgi:hypothetical protein
MFPKTPRQLLQTDVYRRLRQTCTEAVLQRSLSLPPELKQVKALGAALDAIQQRWPDDDATSNTEAPVFLFSAGWRSGSTLLQRLMCSSSELVIWGEPLGDAALLPRLAASLQVLSADWPPDSYIEQDLDLEAFSEQWIANIAPPIDYLRSAHRALFEAWLAKPAREIHGTRLWGFKEVRLTIEHARYLKWLYPQARFVFIYRNLYDAYRSWRGNRWASAWPGYFSWSPVAYARHWKLLLHGYLDGWQQLDGMLIKYEDLIQGKVDMTELAEHIGIDYIDETVLKKRIASPELKQDTKRKQRVTLLERLILATVAGRTLKQAGYK